MNGVGHQGSDERMQKNLSIRVDLLESTMADLNELPGQFKELSSQFLELRSDVRDEVSALRHEVVGMRGEFRALFRRVAADRYDMAHADLPIGPCDLIHLVPRRIDTGEVRSRRNVRLAHDPLDRLMGALAGRAAGTIGHRAEARI